jgi:hypothetical protein
MAYMELVDRKIDEESSVEAPELKEDSAAWFIKDSLGIGL